MSKFFSTSPIYQDAGLALIRLIVGFFMIYHGWEVFSEAKMTEYQQWDMFKNDNGKTMVYLGKGTEFVTGILLALGLFTRISAIILACTMGYIAFFVGQGKIWYEDQFPFMFVLMAAVFLIMGAGPYSLDHLRGGLSRKGAV